MKSKYFNTGLPPLFMCNIRYIMFSVKQTRFIKSTGSYCVSEQMVRNNVWYWCFDRSHYWDFIL